MLDIGWTELLVIAVVLIVVVGPKDLPPMIRAFGKMTKRLRQTAGEFRAQFDEALREAELEDVKRSVDDVRSLNPANSIREALNPLRQMGQEIRSDLERSTRYEAKPGVEQDVAHNSILPELPFGLDEPPEELRPQAQQPAQPAQPGPSAQPGTATAAATPAPPAIPASTADATTTTAVAPATSPATSAPVAPAVEKKRASRKPVAQASKPPKVATKSVKKGSEAASAGEAPKPTKQKVQPAAAKVVAADAPAAPQTKATPASRTRKSKSEDRA